MPEISASPSQQQNQQHAREEQMSERSEVASFKGSESAIKLDEVLDWIDEMPLSKKYYTKSLARDFSDAVLMSDILKHYHPQLVSANNYITVNGISSKKENWNLLNRKVLAKIDMRLSPETIDQLAHSTPGTIERVLITLHDKQVGGGGGGGANKDAKDINSDNEHVVSSLSARSKSEFYKYDVSEKSIFKKVFDFLLSLITGFISIVLTILCFWKWFSKKPHSVQIKDNNHNPSHHKDIDEQPVDNQLRDAYLKSLEDLERHWESIKTLRHKVAFLEGTMKIKDAKIASLQCELDGTRHRHRLDSAGTARLGIDFGQRSARKPRIQI